MTKEQQCEKCKEKDKKARRLQARIRKLEDRLQCYCEREEERLNPTSAAGQLRQAAERRAAEKDYEDWRSS